jgi:isopenicillin-N epimerase
MHHNHATLLAGRRLLADALDLVLPCPDGMVGTLGALPLPDGGTEPPKTPLYNDPLQDALLFEDRIEVPIVPWPAPGKRLVRVSAQIYNTAGDYERLAVALRTRLRRQNS